MDVLRLSPSHGEPLHLLGMIAADHDNHAKAIDLYDRARAAGSNAASALAQKARSLIAMNRRDEAVAAARQAGEESGCDAFCRDTMGVVLSRAGLHEEALGHYRAATSMAPETASYHYNLGAALQFVGDFAGARQAFSRCLEIDPTESRARIARTTITRQTPEENCITELEAAWQERPSGDADVALQLAHALAKSHEDLGSPAQAMEWLAKGKREKLARIANREAEDEACFDAAASLAQSIRIDTHAGDDGPIFITGMPRTGTTLVDRILSSHPLVTSGGELSDFSVILKRAVQTKGPYVLDAETLKASADVNLKQVGLQYTQKVKATLGLNGRFTDKMPLNIFYAPAILAALPNARVICLRRHPADTALSNYRQLFATAFSYYSYAYDLERTARYTVRFHQMIARFEQALPASRFTIADYETIVADQEAQTRRLLAFCGLDFDPACLKFHENAAPVATASAAQVRQPLYRSSLGRWRHYRPAIDPALKILEEAGLMSVSGEGA